MVINNAIIDTGVVSKTGGLNATAISPLQKNINSSNTNKITNNLGSNKTENSENSENNNSNNDSGEVAQDDGKPGAVSTVNSKRNDLKPKVKLGTLESDLDKSPNNNPPRGGPEGYAPHNGLGFNGFPHQGYMGLANPLYGALSALAMPRGTGMGSPPPGMGGSSGGGSGGAGSIKEPQASRPNQRIKQDKVAESHKPDFGERIKQDKVAESPKPDFGERIKPDTQNQLSTEEKRNLAQYNDASNFINKYNEKLREEKEINLKSIPENLQNNLDNAQKSDKKLHEEMNNLLQVREQVLEKAQDLGPKSREFLIGTGDKPVSALEPLKQAYDKVNKHLEDNYDTKPDGTALKAEDLLEESNLLSGANNATADQEVPRSESRSEIIDKIFTSVDDIHDDIPDLSFEDQEFQDFAIDLD
jgi:hypothetical protein